MTDENKNIENVNEEGISIIDANPGDIVKEGEEFYVVEEAEKGPAEPGEKKGDSKEDVGAGPAKPEEKPKGDTKLEITDSMRIKILEKNIGSLKKDLKTATMTPEQIRKNVPLADLEADLPRQRNLLTDIDKEDDPEGWRKQNKIVTTLITDIAEKKQEELINERLNSSENQDFLRGERQRLSDAGYDFSDDQFEGIALAAQDYTKDGKYTRESIQKGLIDLWGSEAVEKMYQTGSEQKLRKDIKSAATRETKSVRVTRSGVSVGLTSLNKRIEAIDDPFELEKALKGLTDEQYASWKNYKQNKK